MAMQLVGKKAVQMYTKKYLNENMQKYSSKEPGGQWDPFFEYRPNKRGKLKKVKKQIPSYIPEVDAEILAKVRKWAYRLDVKHSFMGMRFGWSAVLGAVPEIGDAIDILLAIYVYSLCRKIDGGLDSKTKMKMKAWIATGALIGLVPIVGDIIDASIKPNARNCRILEEYLDQKYKPRAILDEEKRVVADRRRRDPNYAPPAPATVYEGFTDDEHEHDEPPGYRTREQTPAAGSSSSRPQMSERPRRRWSGRR